MAHRDLPLARPAEGSALQCTGACCVVFTFRDPALPGWNENVEDADFIADMLIPLDLVAAAERLERFGVEPYWSDRPFNWDGTDPGDPGRRLFTCRHFDEEKRLCTAYDERPLMCREYPYYKDDCDYRCGYRLTYVEMWDRALRLGGPVHGTPPNIVRGEN